jgi:hypothetical protein
VEPLLPELQEYLQDGRVRHPLLYEDADPDDASRLNQRFLEKQRDAYHAFEQKDWSTYVWLHERAYRLEALLECREQSLYGSEFWALAGEVWQDSENIYQYIDIWREIWGNPSRGLKQCMNNAERRALRKLPDKVEVWRGIRHDDPDSISGLSWTRDRDKAIWFAQRFKGTPLLVEGVVKKTDVLAVFLGKQESEIVSTNVTIKTVRPLDQLTDLAHDAMLKGALSLSPGV